MQNDINVEELVKLQKTLKAVQIEKDMLVKRIENDKLFQDKLISSNDDVSTYLFIDM